MDKIEKSTISITVLKETEEALKSASNAVGVTVGEIVDRLALNWQVKDPAYAAQMILEEMIIHTSGLSKEEVNDVFVIVFSIIQQCGNDLTAEKIKCVLDSAYEN